MRAAWHSSLLPGARHREMTCARSHLIPVRYHDVILRGPEGEVLALDGGGHQVGEEVRACRRSGGCPWTPGRRRCAWRPQGLKGSRGRRPVREGIAVLLEQVRAYGDALRLVETKQRSGSASYRRERINPRSIPAKMIRPPICAGMKKARNRATRGINRGNIRSFAVVAGVTRISEVIESRPPAMFGGNDMIGLVRHQRYVIG